MENVGCQGYIVIVSVVTDLSHDKCDSLIALHEILNTKNMHFLKCIS